MEQQTLPKFELHDSNGQPNARNIRLAAAMLGPGYKGRRAELGTEERSAAAEEVAEAWTKAQLGEVPAYLIAAMNGEETGWRDRRAKLFEAGAYEDKEIRADQADLQRLAAKFDFPAPVLIEHVENPLRLGYLTDVEAVGPELFGILTLTEEADELIEQSGAKSLSVSVNGALDTIYEVSIVGNPRVESARLFCADFREGPTDDKWKREALRLRHEMEKEKVDGIVSEMIGSGSIPPCAKESAVALFSAARKHGLETALRAFCESLPKATHFGELAPAGKAPAGVDSEEAAFYASVFPNLQIEEIMKRKVK